MNYTLLDHPEQLHDAFRRRFTLPYGAYCHSHAERLASLPDHYRRGFTPAYYERLPYSDRLISDFQALPFEAALKQLAQLGSVLFLTNPPGGLMRDYNPLGTETHWAARIDGAELASTIREEWFRQYALWDQDMNDPDQLFGSEIFVFTEDLRRCIVFTHETDETELPETRVCLTFSACD